MSRSRRMESSRGGAGVTPLPLADLLGASGPYLHISSPAGLEIPGMEACAVASPRVAPDQTFEAVVWHRNDLHRVESELAEVRRRLAPGGRLVLVHPAAAGPDHQEREGRERSRGLIRALSEAGFVVDQESTVADTPGLGPSAAIVARRDTFSIRPFRAGDEAGIGRLFAASFHQERPPARWAWAYRDNPWAQLAISLAESAEGDLVAHYAGYGSPFWYRGRRFVALQIGDTMTDPGFRQVGRGTSSLLARTVRHFFACHRERGFGFFYGFNRGPIQRFCQWFIGGMEVEPVHYRWRESAAPWPASGERYRVTQTARAGAAWDRLFSRAAPSYGYLVARDAEYVTWRYLACPEPRYVVLEARRRGRLVAWSVFRRRDEALVWGDALVHPDHLGAAASLLDRALVHPELAGAEAIEAWFPERPAAWSTELERLGFESRPHPQKLGFMILGDEETVAPTRELYYTMGDGDLF